MPSMLGGHRNRHQGLVWAVAVLAGAALSARPAAAYTIQNNLGVPVNARVNPGGVNKNIPANGKETVAPAGARDAMLTAEIQTDDFDCVVPIQADGTLAVQYFDE